MGLVSHQVKVEGLRHSLGACRECRHWIKEATHSCAHTDAQGLCYAQVYTMIYPLNILPSPPSLSPCPWPHPAFPCSLQNAPRIRYKLIEDKLQLSDYLQWTFLSCTGPMKVKAGAGEGGRVSDCRMPVQLCCRFSLSSVSVTSCNEVTMQPVKRP